MREFINKHPRWYLFIVVSVAVLAFTIVTCIGCGKLEKAEAAERTIKLTWKGTEQYISQGDYKYYLHMKGIGDYGDMLFLSNVKLGIKIESSNWTIACYDENGVQDNTVGKFRTYGAFYMKAPDLIVDTVSDITGVSMGSTPRPSASNVVANYDVIRVDTGAVLYESNVGYSLDAPYTNFQCVTVNYGYEAEDLDDFYADWMTANEWKYFGHLNNIHADDLSYSIEPVVRVQLPTVDYLISLFSAEGLDLAVDGESSAFGMYKFFKCLPELVQTWYNDKNAPYVEYEFECAFDLELDANGNFTYGFTFLELEYLLKAFNSDLLAEFEGYSTDFRAIYMTFAHVECVTSAVETTREDVILYGKITTNQFRRGIYDTCIEVIPEIDINTATPEEIDKILSDATQDAHDKYIKDLEQRVEQLEAEMNNATGSLGSFDSEFSGNGLWGAIKGLGNGLLSMTGFLASVAGIFGSVFGFLPYDVQQIVGYFLIISLLVALWKLIKG